jgi:hypothetical protein
MLRLFSETQEKFIALCSVINFVTIGMCQEQMDMMTNEVSETAWKVVVPVLTKHHAMRT